MRTQTSTGRRWGEFWKDRRNGKTVTEIAKKNEISVQAVYKALRSKNSKIDTLLLATARANRIHVYLHDSVEGFLWGYSPVFKSYVYITHSPKTGIQVWYEHEGHCGECDALTDCLWILKTEAAERQITVPRNIETPAEIALYIFEAIKKKLEWNESDIKDAQKYSPRKNS